ncbi:MAG: AAA family ATPase [Bacilli bacterium]|nr:AAA family ATPase [Bacilli bacterium]
MIQKVNNFSLKSFKNYTTPENLFFKKVNVFFGCNGKGKSSLAEGVASEIKNVDKISEENYRIFSKDYLKLKLINDKRRLKGVKAVFGNKNVKNDKEIEVLKEKLEDTSKLMGEINSNFSLMDSLVKTIEDGVRGSKKIRHISILTEEDLTTYKTTFETLKDAALKITTEDKLKTITANIDFEKKRNELELLPSVSLNNINKSLDIASEIINHSYKTENIPATEVLDWIEQGLDLHKESATCLFCGSNLDNLTSIKKHFEEYINNTRQKDERILMNFSGLLDSEILKIDTFVGNENMFKNCDIEVSSQIKSLLSYKNNLVSIKDVLEKKFQKFESVYIVDFKEVKESFIEATGALYTVQKFVEDSKAKIAKEENKLNDLLKGLIALKVLNNKQIADLAKQTNSKILSLKTIERSNELIKEQIKNLKNKSKVTSDFAEFINGILLDLDIKFKLDIVEDDYRIVPLKSDDEIDIDNISEGERNLLSLLFFYFELFEDNMQEHFKEDIKYIVVDDPLSSLDDNNRTYLISILQMLFKQNDVQVFVFTHDWDAYCQLLYNVDKSKYASFEIKKDKNGISTVVIGKPTITPYEHDFFELIDFSKKTADSLDDGDVYHLPNCIRRVLEVFLKFKVLNCSPTASNINNVTIGLFNKETLDAKENVKLMSLLTVINSKSHEAARNSEEVYKALKFLVKQIETADKTHFNMLKNKKAQYEQMNGENL